MNKYQRGIILALVLGAVIAVLWLKQTSTPTESPVTEQTTLPRLVDLGADKCTSCKLMAPILTDLGTRYTNQLQVTFIDVWVHEEAADPYNIQMIPTQIYFDADGQELYRHEGFFSKEDILSKWKELGYEFQ